MKEMKRLRIFDEEQHPAEKSRLSHSLRVIKNGIWPSLTVSSRTVKLSSCTNSPVSKIQQAFGFLENSSVDPISQLPLEQPLILEEVSPNRKYTEESLFKELMLDSRRLKMREQAIPDRESILLDINELIWPNPEFVDSIALSPVNKNTAEKHQKPFILIEEEKVAPNENISIENKRQQDLKEIDYQSKVNHLVAESNDHNDATGNPLFYSEIMGTKGKRLVISKLKGSVLKLEKENQNLRTQVMDFALAELKK
jgi:hypothetical protein